MASGLSMPVGFKNTTSGDLVAAINAVKAASRPQTFLGVSEEGIASSVTTTGNPDCHVILRGGDHGPNYDADSISAARAALEGAKLPPSLIVDASHRHIPKGYIYFAMAFSIGVEMLNLKLRKKGKPVQLHDAATNVPTQT